MLYAWFNPLSFEYFIRKRLQSEVQNVNLQLLHEIPFLILAKILYILNIF